MFIEDFSIRGLKTKIPTIVRKEAINPSKDRNSWSNFKTSISNHVPPWPTPGIALKANIMIAVPISIFFAFKSNSFDNLKSKNNIIAKEPINTISWEKPMFEVPIVNVKITKIIEPIIINKFGLVATGTLKIIWEAFLAPTPLARSNLYLFCRNKYAKKIPEIDITGTIKENK